MPKFITIRELADQATFLVKDYQQLNRMRFNKLAADWVFPDLQMDVVKEAKRVYLHVNKRTNSIDIPCDNIEVSSVSWVDQWGIIRPIYRNTRLHNDIVDLGAKKDCACSCKNELCNMIRGYESVITYVDAEMPDHSIQTFTCTNRKWTDASGVYYEQIQKPEREYVNGEWVDTILATENIELCTLEVDADGCVVDCDENFRLVNSCGCSFFGDNCGVPVCIPEQLNGYKLVQNISIESGRWFAMPCQFKNIYNINDAGDKLIFPHDFAFDKVLLRYYSNVPMQEMKIPFVAAYAAICGIMWYNICFDPMQAALERIWSAKYAAAKFALLQELNKYSQEEMWMLMTPPVYVP